MITSGLVSSEVADNSSFEMAVLAAKAFFSSRVELLHKDIPTHSYEPLQDGHKLGLT